MPNEVIEEELTRIRFQVKQLKADVTRMIMQVTTSINQFEGMLVLYQAAIENLDKQNPKEQEQK